MRVIKRCFVLVPVVAIALITSPASVQAGSEANEMWGYTESGWEKDTRDAIEAMLSVSYDSYCLSVDVDVEDLNEERDFTVKISYPGIQDTSGIGAGATEDLQDLLDCFSGLRDSQVQLQEDFESWESVVMGAWMDLDGPNGPPLSFSCIDVSTSEVGNSEIPGAVGLVNASAPASVNSFDVNSANGVSFGSARIENLSVLGLLFLLDDSSEYLDDTELTWVFDISIDECGGGWDGPDIDIEHYRRRAEQATALPDTL